MTLDTIQFPCSYPMSVITTALDDQQLLQLQRTMQTVNNELHHQKNASTNGTYQSYRFRIKARDAEHIQLVYDALRQLPFVKMVL